MEAGPNFVPTGVDGGNRGMGVWNGKVDSRFEWVASSPSPAAIEALQRRFPEVIHIPAQLLEPEVAGWRTSGVIVRSLLRWVPAEAIVREFRRFGITGEIETVSLAHRHHLIRFAEPAAREAVLRQPWMANGQLLAVEEWRPQFVPAEGTMLSALIWIRLPSLPIEFWTEDIIGAICSVAGEFRFIDEATRARRRGGYARACVRVDLSRPLRPGARIRGDAGPFWQSFAYEHLEGICSACGSLHQGDVCSSDQADDSVQESLFGPWMAALRRRRPPQPVVVNSEVKGKNPEAGSSGAWSFPKKVARRSRMPGLGGGAGPKSGQHAGDGSKEGMMGKQAEGCVVQGGVGGGKNGSGRAVPARSVDTVNSEPVSQCEVVSVNPFAALGSDIAAGRPKSRSEVNPGPLKRARPIESAAPRVVVNHRKGKGKQQGNRPIQSSFIAPVDKNGMNGDVSFRGFGKSVHSPDEAEGQIRPSDGPLRRMEGGMSHDTVVSILKEAIQPKVSDDVMVTLDQQSLADISPVGCPPGTERIGDGVGTSSS